MKNRWKGLSAGSHHLGESARIRTWRIVFCVLLTLFLMTAGLCFVVHKYALTTDIAYNYASREACVRYLTLMPHKTVIRSKAQFSTQAAGVVKISGYPVMSSKLCITPAEAPSPGSLTRLDIRPFGVPVYAGNITVRYAEYPKVARIVTPLSQPVATSGKIEATLTQTDKVFEYRISHGSKTSDCEVRQTSVACSVGGLELEQGQKYNLELDQAFGGKKVRVVEELPIETHRAVVIEPVAIVSGSTVYGPISSIEFKSDKVLATGRVAVTQSGGSGMAVESKTEIKDSHIIVSFATELPRKQQYTFDFSTFVAHDGATPAKGFAYTVNTSGAPRVTGSTLKSSSNSRNLSFSVTFDQPIDQASLQNELRISAGDQPFGFTISRLQGSTATITIDGTIAPCVVVAVTVGQNVKSPHGYGGESQWSRSGRTVCYTISSIGTSLQGRLINSYTFGSGETLLFVGATHGAERGTARLLQRWIDELDARPEKIPAGKRIIVVPIHNPDGYANGTRNNSRNVDINRNFPTSDWKTDVDNPSGGTLVGGGGTSPLSEPEAAAVANLVTSLRPKATYIYHSQGSIVLSNDSGSAWSRTLAYARQSGYAAKNMATIGSTFDYKISGALDDWMREIELAAVLIELSSHSNDDFSRNVPAMWEALSL